MTTRTPSQYIWDTCSFNDSRLPASPRRVTSPRRQPIKGVTIHHTAMVGTSESALQSVKNAWKTREASAHYGVVGPYVWQFVSDNDEAWACANSTGNQTTLSIEHVNNTAGPSWKVSDETFKTGARLVAHLHKLYKLGRPTLGKTLFQHKDWYNTACAGPYLGGSQLKAYETEARRVYDSIIGATPAPAPTPEGTPAAITIAKITDERLYEFSGAVRSVRNPGHFWAIKDENGPIYLVREKDMKIVKEVKLKGVTLIDPEAIAYDPINKTLNLWDGGDNDSNRKNVIIYSFREPELAGGNVSVDSVAIKLTYSNGSKRISTNTETLVVHPAFGRLVFSKTSPGRMYHQEGSTLVLKTQPVLSYPTDGEVSEDGAFFYEIRKDHDAIEVYDTNTWTHLGSLPHKDSKQPEALWWHSGGKHLLVGSEKSSLVIAVAVPDKWRKR